MGAGSLEERHAVGLAPDDKPVSGIRDMALAAALPCPLEAVHTVPPRKYLARFRRVLDDEVDDLRQLSLVEPTSTNYLQLAREQVTWTRNMELGQ